MLRGVSQAASAESSDVTVGTTTVTGGTDGRILYDNAGVLGEKTVTGTGSVVLATSPTLVSPLLGTPTSGVATNLTGTAAGLTAGTVTTNANLTGDVTSVGNATTLTNAPVIAKVLTGYTSGAGTVASTDSILQAIQKLNGNDATNANLTGPITSSGNATSIASQTGTGTKFVVDTAPTLVTPVLGIATATSVNKVTITAPATSATLTIADGTTLTETTSTSIGKGQYLATATNDSAMAGNIGEFASGTASGVSMSSSTNTDITSVSLTAGDWDCWGTVTFTTGAATAATTFASWLSTTSATDPNGLNSGARIQYNYTFPTVIASTFSIGKIRISLSGTTTLYLTGIWLGSGTTPNGSGFIGARRRR